jgi:hypothetical protein
LGFLPEAGKYVCMRWSNRPFELRASDRDAIALPNSLRRRVGIDEIE